MHPITDYSMFSEYAPMRVLIAEDDRLSRRMLEANLHRWEYDVVAVENGVQAWEVLQTDNPPRIAILDWMMPELDGIDLCRKIRDDRTRDFTYIIILTARNSKEDAILALESGADDYLTKPYDAAELRCRIGVGRRIIKLQTELENANRKLYESSTTDALTRVFNRRAIMDHLAREMMRARRENQNMVVIMGDVDHFKSINDNFGHDCGDKVLIEVARRLSTVCRPYDRIGRYGGEEFLIVASDIPPDKADALGQRFLMSINNAPFNTEYGELHVTVSMGLVCVPTDCSGSSESVTRAADALLYEAKALGRNRVISAHPRNWNEIHRQIEPPPAD